MEITRRLELQDMFRAPKCYDGIKYELMKRTMDSCPYLGKPVCMMVGPKGRSFIFFENPNIPNSSLAVIERNKGPRKGIDDIRMIDMDDARVVDEGGIRGRTLHGKIDGQEFRVSLSNPLMNRFELGDRGSPQYKVIRTDAMDFVNLNGRSEAFLQERIAKATKKWKW
jgi:hypothetical protein